MKFKKSNDNLLEQNAYVLISPSIKTSFQEVGDQSEVDNPIVITKFFNPCGAGTWYATEYNEEDNCCFGYVTGLGYDEWGSFSINELQAISLPFGMKIERDLYFQSKRFNDLNLNL